ncbi:hypothetical protein [Paraclostridium bifermentans]|uniref:hypothetical protein n=1 Tax=Paraclostridium bifermentans TaxID=1490 RepID=UPI00374E9EE1
MASILGKLMSSNKHGYNNDIDFEETEDGRNLTDEQIEELKGFDVMNPIPVVGSSDFTEGLESLNEEEGVYETLSKEELIDTLNIYLEALKNNNELKDLEEYEKRCDIMCLGQDYEDLRLTCTILEVLDDYSVNGNSDVAYIKLSKILGELTGRTYSMAHIRFNDNLKPLMLWHPGTFNKWRLYL